MLSHSDMQKFGLGCSRMGSINGLSLREAEALVGQAVDLGVRFFDTSNIYGQGDSERALGRALRGKQGVVLCTKGGRHITKKSQLLVPAKGILRFLARNSKKARGKVAAAREAGLPMNWDPKFLAESLEGSLKRLQVEAIDMYLLHGPTPEVLRRGEAIDALDRAKQQGKIREFGVSIDDTETGLLSLEDKRIRVLQVPLIPNHKLSDLLDRSASADVTVIAREILGGKATVAAATNKEAFLRDRIAEQESDPRVHYYLIGTTSATNLKQSWALAQSVRASLETA